VILSVLAFFNELIYAPLMADIFKKNPVFKTLRENYVILIKTMFLGVIIIYIFSVVSFLFLHG
jgi:hypothetical protein